MIWKQFTHLGNFPPELKARFNSFLTTEFDDSLSVEMQLRSIIKWCQDNFKTVDTLIDFINDISNWLTQFEINFDTKLEESVSSVLSEWQTNGQLDIIISEVLQWELESYKKTNEQDKLFMQQAIDTKLGGTNKVEPTDLSPETLGLVTGTGEPISIESVPQDESVTKEKMSLSVQQTKFFELPNKLPPLTASNWSQTGTAVTDIDGGIKVTTGIGTPYSRTGATLDVNEGQTIFVRVKMKVDTEGALRNRVMLRNGTSGNIHFQNLYENPGTTLQTYYFSFTITETLNTPTLFIDTIYDDITSGRINNIYEATVINVSDVSTITPNTEFINSMTYQGTDLFNAYGVIRTLNDLTLKEEKTGVDYKKPPLYYWGAEYLHSWYEKIIDKEPIKMVWGGDSTTQNTGLLDGYKRNQLGKKIMVQGGYPIESVTSINKGHGENTTLNWLNQWLDEDLAESPDLYILGYGLNDGGSNYFSGTPTERALGFESRIRQGLNKIRELHTANDLPIIITMPVTTNSTSSDRTTEKWHDIIRPIIQKACRDYQCCFVDVALFQYDRTNGSYWSSNGDNVHPNRYATVHYMSLLSDVLYPKLLQGDFNIL